MSTPVVLEKLTLGILSRDSVYHILLHALNLGSRLPIASAHYRIHLLHHDIRQTCLSRQAEKGLESHFCVLTIRPGTKLLDEQ